MVNKSLTPAIFVISAILLIKLISSTSESEPEKGPELLDYSHALNMLVAGILESFLDGEIRNINIAVGVDPNLAWDYNHGKHQNDDEKPGSIYNMDKTAEDVSNILFLSFKINSSVITNAVTKVNGNGLKFLDVLRVIETNLKGVGEISAASKFTKLATQYTEISNILRNKMPTPGVLDMDKELLIIKKRYQDAGVKV